MARGIVAVGVCSVVIIVLFVVMCFLLGNFTPPPLKFEEPAEETHSNILQFENVVFGDGPPPGDIPQYELDKVEVDNIELVSTIQPVKLARQNTAINYSVWRFTPRKVVPPLWPTTTGFRTAPTHTAITTTSTMPLNHKHGLDKTEVELSESLPIKGHRRSISGLKNDDDKPAFVILKILDNSGDSKIEIKLGPDNSAKRRKNRDNKSKNKSKFSMSLQSNTNDQIKKRVLARNTIISVMPNNSIVIDEYERIITDGKKKTKEIMKIDENITNDMKAKITIPHVNNKIIRNVTDYEDVLFTKANGKGTGTAEMFVNKDVYTNTLFNNNKPDFGTVQNIVNNVTYSIGVTETKPSFTPKIDEVNSTSSVVTTTEKQEYLIIPTLLMLQGEHLSNNDISNTFLFDDFVLAQNSTEKFRPVTNVSMIDEHFTDLVTPVTVQDINLMADVNVPTDGSPSSVTNVPNANVESFDLLSKLDALSENSTLTSIESISQDDNIHVRTEHAIKEETSTILTTNLTLHDELRSDTITNVAIQNDHYVILATTQNEDVVPANAAVNSTVANENANVENNTKNNLV